MISAQGAVPDVSNAARRFLSTTDWRDAACEHLTGDASARQYFRLRRAGAPGSAAVLMDASRNLESLAPFIRIGRHLAALGFSTPAILALDETAGIILLEDFGDDTFARLLGNGASPETLYALATDVLIALHRHPQSIPPGLRAYDPEKMLEDILLFLDWRTPGIPNAGRDEFHQAWREVLPAAHQVPVALLLRDYHVANLMLLPDRDGVRQAGLLDFQDAYQGPASYDLISLLEDARRDIPATLVRQMLNRYTAAFPELDRTAFDASLAILAAVRHTRVLAIFERLSRRDGKHDYRRLHTPRVERLLQQALSHPALERVQHWMQRYAPTV
jgi:aminoglycoside/choline kinase family phosphotransferase